MGISNYNYKKDHKWLFEEPTLAQIRLMDNIVSVIPESKEKRDKCINKGMASRFIDTYKKMYDEIKADRIAMMEDEIWKNITLND